MLPGSFLARTSTGRAAGWISDAAGPTTVGAPPLETFATGATRGDTISSWFAEKRSAKTMAREELQRLLADVRAGRQRGQRLYLFRLDRLTRTGIADTLTTLEELRAHGVDVVSVADGFDLNGPHAEVIIAVMAWAAKMERLATAERISAARELSWSCEAHGGVRPRGRRPLDCRRARASRSHGVWRQP
jgi:DNA invertase Pin-like site-specific DNA recombinase